MADIPGTNYYNGLPANTFNGNTASNYIPFSGTWTYTIPITVPTSGQISMPLETPAEPAKKKDADGLACKKCDEMYPYAEPNQDDGTLICYACRHNL